ncbi:hypothetical protein NBRC116493_27480 [Aurantivibrio infirmus]
MSNEEQTVEPQRKRTQLIIIFGLAIAATFIPYLMYFTGIGIPTGTVNNGRLIAEPVSLADANIRTSEGELLKLAEPPFKFRMIFLVNGECDSQCRDLLFLTRQVHTRLSDKGDQFERLYIDLSAQSSKSLEDFLNEEHPKLRYARSDLSEWQDLLSSTSEISQPFTGHEYLLTHRYGALSMVYDDVQTGNELLKDLKFLVRTSN